MLLKVYGFWASCSLVVLLSFLLFHICQMNIYLSLYSVLSLFFALFGTNSAEHIEAKIYQNSQVVSNSKVENKFNKLLDHYYMFYDNNAKHIAVKMGDKSYIKRTINTTFENDLLDISYEEKLNLCSDSFEIEVELKEFYFYNRKRTRYERLVPEDIKAGSFKARMISSHLKDIKENSDRLFNSALKVITEPQLSQAYQR